MSMQDVTMQKTKVVFVHLRHSKCPVHGRLSVWSVVSWAQWVTMCREHLL